MGFDGVDKIRVEQNAYRVGGQETVVGGVTRGHDPVSSGPKAHLPYPDAGTPLDRSVIACTDSLRIIIVLIAMRTIMVCVR